MQKTIFLVTGFFLLTLIFLNAAPIMPKLDDRENSGNFWVEKLSTETIVLIEKTPQKINEASCSEIKIYIDTNVNVGANAIESNKLIIKKISEQKLIREKQANASKRLFIGVNNDPDILNGMKKPIRKIAEDAGIFFRSSEIKHSIFLFISMWSA